VIGQDTLTDEPLRRVEASDQICGRDHIVVGEYHAADRRQRQAVVGRPTRIESSLTPRTAFKSRRLIHDGIVIGDWRGTIQGAEG